MPIYKIPFYERFVGDPCGLKKRECISVDGVGLIVYHRGDIDLSPENIRRCLIGEQKIHCKIEADSLAAAIDIFSQEFEGARVGEKSKAWRIDSSDKILELPHCSRLHKNSRGEYICGEPVEDNFDNGEFGMCVFEGYDYPDEECPLHLFYQKFYEMETAKTLPIEIVGGFNLVRAANII